MGEIGMAGFICGGGDDRITEAVDLHVSVNSKPSVIELYAVNNEAFMVDKKYVNVTDLNLMSDEKVSIYDRDDLEKKIDDV
ncbi:hypothetical protein Tco_0781518 [Tanacetum coccineum]